METCKSSKAHTWHWHITALQHFIGPDSRNEEIVSTRTGRSRKVKENVRREAWKKWEHNYSSIKGIMCIHLKVKKFIQGHIARKQQRQDLRLNLLTENLTLFQHFFLVLLIDLCSPDITSN